jgi:hypothetical protein
VHTTAHGHTAHAHVNANGKVFALSATHPKDGNVRTKKVVTRQKRHALAQLTGGRSEGRKGGDR